MTHPRRLLPVLVGVGLLIGATAASAQTLNPGHKTYVHLPPDGDVVRILTDKLLKQRGGFADLEKVLDHLKAQGGAFQFLGKGLDPQKLDLPPQQRQQLQDLIDKLKGDKKPTPEQIKAFERLLREPQTPRDPVKPPDVASRPPGKVAPQPTATRGQAPPPARDPGGDWLARLTKHLEHSRFGEQLSESAAWQRWLRNLADNAGGKFDLGLGGLGDFGSRLPLPKGLDLSLPDFSKFQMPDISLPSLPRPNLDVSLPGVDSWLPAPSVNLSGLAGPEGAGAALSALQGPLWVALGAVIALLFWRAVGRSAWQGRRGATVAARLGPWPVDPARVSTRAELVQAFEHLALLLLGPDARSRNHRDIAEDLAAGAASTEKGRAADELAALYEQARYAPGDTPFAAPEIDAARRNLCLLAGVAAA